MNEFTFSNSENNNPLSYLSRHLSGQEEKTFKDELISDEEFMKKLENFNHDCSKISEIAIKAIIKAECMKRLYNKIDDSILTNMSYKEYLAMVKSSNSKRAEKLKDFNKIFFPMVLLEFDELSVNIIKSVALDVNPLDITEDVWNGNIQIDLIDEQFRLFWIKIKQKLVKKIIKDDTNPIILSYRILNLIKDVENRDKTFVSHCGNDIKAYLKLIKETPKGGSIIFDGNYQGNAQGSIEMISELFSISKSILVIISENFLNSEWCMAELLVCNILMKFGYIVKVCSLTPIQRIKKKITDLGIKIDLMQIKIITIDELYGYL